VRQRRNDVIPRAAARDAESGELRTRRRRLIDFETERGQPRGGNDVFASIEQLLEKYPWAKATGIVEVSVSLLRVVQPPDPDHARPTNLR
jgi:hypothetical protein